jgi:hypothetical protein
MFTFPKMKKVFRDAAMQEEFEKNGFVIVDFYTSEEVEEVKALYHKLHPKDEEGFFPSTFSKDKNYRETTDSELRRIGDRRFNELLMDFQVINGSFIVKSPGQDSYLHVHQDMTLVDESEFTGINIWTTTVDLTDSNGVLYALPGSHRFYPSYRGHTLRGFYDGIQEEIKDYMTAYYLRAGQAVIFDQSIIHFSPPNLGDQIRIVSNVYFTHKEARFLICYHKKNDSEWMNRVELFEQDMSFMTNYEQFGANIYDRPRMGKSLGLVHYDFPELTIDELESRFGKRRLREFTPTKKVELPSVEEASVQTQGRDEVTTKEKLPFWKVYTPSNVVKEIKYRLSAN